MLSFSILIIFIMYKTLFKTFIVILLVSLLMLLSIPFISNKIHFITLFSFIGYFYLTLFFFKIFGEKFSAISIVIIIFVTMLLLQSYTILMWFIFRDFFGLPAVITYFLGVMSAYFYFKSKPPKNILFFSLSSCFVVFMFFQGYDYWLHKIDYGTFTGEVQAYNLPTKFEAVNESQNIIKDENFRNKIVLLDFWTTTCGICFQKFPQVQLVHEKYKNDPSIMILAVNTPIEEDKPNQAFNDILEAGHSFPVVITKDEDLAEKWGVKGYPTTFVINPNGQIVYKGDIEGAVKMVDELKSSLR
jgi:thiol-disulfide isomerase/thioredoxin